MVSARPGSKASGDIKGDAKPPGGSDTKKLGRAAWREEPSSQDNQEHDDGDADELDLQVKVKRCVKGSEAYKRLEEEGTEVTECQFGEDLASTMMMALEKDDDGDDRRLDSDCSCEYWCGVTYCYETLYCI